MLPRLSINKEPILMISSLIPSLVLSQLRSGTKWTRSNVKGEKKSNNCMFLPMQRGPWWDAWIAKQPCQPPIFLYLMISMTVSLCQCHSHSHIFPSNPTLITDTIPIYNPTIFALKFFSNLRTSDFQNSSLYNCAAKNQEPGRQILPGVPFQSGQIRMPQNKSQIVILKLISQKAKEDLSP